MIIYVIIVIWYGNNNNNNNKLMITKCHSLRKTCLIICTVCQKYELIIIILINDTLTYSNISNMELIFYHQIQVSWTTQQVWRDPYYEIWIYSRCATADACVTAPVLLLMPMLLLMPVLLLLCYC